MVWAVAFDAFVPIGVADTWMFPIEPFTGAVRATVAWPFDAVTTSDCDSAVPCGAFAARVTVMRWPAIGRY